MSVERCLSDTEYRSCRFYEEVSKPIGAPVHKRLELSGLYLPIHGLTHIVRCDCPHFTVDRHESGLYVAYCRVLNRFLTKYEVQLCRDHWKRCPYRKYHPQPRIGEEIG